MLLRYDERGCGLSDWNVNDFSFEAWVRDLEAVVEASGVERFPLIGISQGGPIAIAYAARHPEKVSHLILYGSYARGKLKRDLAPEKIEEVETLIKLIRLGWGQENPAFRQVFASMFIPDGTLEQYRQFNDLQRASASPENVPGSSGLQHARRASKHLADIHAGAARTRRSAYPVRGRPLAGFASLVRGW
jgi:pimeloyl-ACP methyl ester carboxylesterase